MPCLPIASLPIPELPFPLTIGPPIIDIEFDPKLCCKLLPFPLVVPPIPLPPGTLNPAIVAVIQAQLASMNTYFDALPFKCPRD
jgi:hypothetical protein